MPDEMDFAQKRSQQYLEEIKKKREFESKVIAEPQLIINGVVVCKDCEEPIPLKRLELIPHCVRCVHCQQELEGK